MANKSGINIYSLLQADTSAPSSAEGPRGGKAGAAVVGGQQTPAERAAIRAKANAEKAAVADAAKQRADADAAAAALVGPLDGFVTQKSSQPKKERDVTKQKKTREQFEKDPQDPSAPRKTYDKKPYVPRDGGSGERKPYAKDGLANERRRDPKPAGNEGFGARPPRREFDKHSAGKTGNKFQNKRQGEGAANWGNAVTDATTGNVAGWGDEGNQTTKVEAGEAANQWGDEGEAKSEPAKDDSKADADEKKDDAPAKPTKPAEPAWDDEGFGKMTLQDYQKTVAAEQKAALEKLAGQKERRAADAVDLKKFQVCEKDTTDEKDELLKKKAKEPAKKAAGAARSGEKAVALDEALNIRGPRGGRGRGRPEGSDGERPPRNTEGRPTEGGNTEGGRGQGGNRGRGGPGRVNANNYKQFPDLGGNKPKPQHVK